MDVPLDETHVEKLKKWSLNAAKNSNTPKEKLRLNVCTNEPAVIPVTTI